MSEFTNTENTLTLTLTLTENMDLRFGDHDVERACSVSITFPSTNACVDGPNSATAVPAQRDCHLIHL
jgi:hypothetical protein